MSIAFSSFICDQKCDQETIALNSIPSKTRAVRARTSRLTKSSFIWGGDGGGSYPTHFTSDLTGITKYFHHYPKHWKPHSIVRHLTYCVKAKEQEYGQVFEAVICDGDTSRASELDHTSGVLVELKKELCKWENKEKKFFDKRNKPLPDFERYEHLYSPYPSDFESEEEE